MRARQDLVNSVCGNQLNVSTYLVLEDGCPLDFSVLGSGQVEVTCGDPRDECQLMLDAESLRRFLTLGREALREMDEMFARESAGEATAVTCV